MFFSVFQECLLLLSDCCGMCWSGVVDGGMCWSGVVDSLIWILRAKNCVLCVESEKGAVFWWLVMALGSFLFFLGCLSFWAQFWGGELATIGSDLLFSPISLFLWFGVLICFSLIYLVLDFKINSIIILKWPICFTILVPNSYHVRFRSSLILLLVSCRWIILLFLEIGL